MTMVALVKSGEQAPGKTDGDAQSFGLHWDAAFHNYTMERTRREPCESYEVGRGEPWEKYDILVYHD